MITKREMERLKELIQKATEESEAREILTALLDHSCDTMGMPAYWWE